MRRSRKPCRVDEKREESCKEEKREEEEEEEKEERELKRGRWEIIMWCSGVQIASIWV
jgi:hypothetical protein